MTHCRLVTPLGGGKHLCKSVGSNVGGRVGCAVGIFGCCRAPGDRPEGLALPTPDVATSWEEERRETPEQPWHPGRSLRAWVTFYHSPAPSCRYGATVREKIHHDITHVLATSTASRRRPRVAGDALRGSESDFVGVEDERNGQSGLAIGPGSDRAGTPTKGLIPSSNSNAGRRAI